MTRDELAALKQQVDWLRPDMHIELPVKVVRELLDLVAHDDYGASCEACGKQPALIDGGDAGAGVAWLCEGCADEMRAGDD